MLDALPVNLLTPDPMVNISTRLVFKIGNVQCLSWVLVLFPNLFAVVLGSGGEGSGDCDSEGVESTLPASPLRRLTCDEAEQDCIGRLTCGMAFHVHRLDCKRELAGRTPGRCSVHCRQSLVSLASTEEGYAYIGCECGSDKFCQALRLRLASCWWQKPCSSRNATAGLQLSGGLTLIPSSPSFTMSASSSRQQCSQLAQECMSYPVCAVAWHYYRLFCQDVLDGAVENCSSRCRNSVRILVRMEKAHRLLDCACDVRVKGVTCVKELNRIRLNCFRIDGIHPSGCAGGLLSSFVAVVMLTLIVLLVSV